MSDTAYQHVPDRPGYVGWGVVRGMACLPSNSTKVVQYVHTLLTRPIGMFQGQTWVV